MTDPKHEKKKTLQHKTEEKKLEKVQILKKRQERKNIEHRPKTKIISTQKKKDVCGKKKCFGGGGCNFHEEESFSFTKEAKEQCWTNKKNLTYFFFYIPYFSAPHKSSHVLLP